MNDTARLAWHRAAETDGSTTPAQSRSPVNLLERRLPQPWHACRSLKGCWQVWDSDDELVVDNLSERDARVIAAAHDLYEQACNAADILDQQLKGGRL